MGKTVNKKRYLIEGLMIIAIIGYELFYYRKALGGRELFGISGDSFLVMLVCAAFLSYAVFFHGTGTGSVSGDSLLVEGKKTGIPEKGMAGAPDNRRLWHAMAVLFLCGIFYQPAYGNGGRGIWWHKSMGKMEGKAEMRRMSGICFVRIPMPRWSGSSARICRLFAGGDGKMHMNDEVDRGRAQLQSVAEPPKDCSVMFMCPLDPEG